jgi:hypothetical protein
MGLLANLGKGAYKAATSKPGAGLIIGGAVTAGILKNAAPAARDAAMEVAFGDPNADESFLGRKLTPGSVFDAVAPVTTGGGGTAGAVGTVGAVGLGAGLGVAAGARLGGMIKNPAGSRLATKALRGGAIGGIVGAGLGAAAVGAAIESYVSRNERFFKESPYAGKGRTLRRDNMQYDPGMVSGSYNVSLKNASDLNADGSIVLGMHNLRKGI